MERRRLIGKNHSERSGAARSDLYGKPVVYTIAAERMEKQRYKFYRSVNGVWLTKKVPTQFLAKIDKGISSLP